jgi:hypothetical protein
MSDIVKRQNTAVSTEVHGTSKQDVLSSDLQSTIGRVYLMQKTSDLVEDDLAKVGDFIRSTNNEKLGDQKTPLMFIPLKMTNEWNLEEQEGGRFQWRGREPRTAANENMPWLFEQNGKQWRRVKIINVFALLPVDLKDREAKVEAAIVAGELPDPVMPVVISFRSTSFKAGAKVGMFFKQVEELVESYKQATGPWKYQLPLTNSKQENEKGTFQVMDVGKAQKLPDDMQAEARRWYEILNSAAFEALQVDTDEVADELPIEVTATAQVKRSQF